MKKEKLSKIFINTSLASLALSSLLVLSCEKPTKPQPSTSQSTATQEIPTTVFSTAPKPPETGQTPKPAEPTATSKPAEKLQPTSTPRIEMPADAPAPAQDAFTKLDELASKLTNPAIAKQYQKMLQEAATYNDPKLPPGFAEASRGGMYAAVYNELVGQYYATHDPEILKLAQSLRSFIQEKYPVTYGSVQRSDGWKITGE